MRRCVLMRHGETAMAGRFCGHSDPDLNDAGRRQIVTVLSKLGFVPDAIYASDLRRASQSAELIAQHFHTSVHVRAGLREIGFGVWEGLCWQEVEKRYPREARAWIECYPRGTIPAGESYDAFRTRVAEEVAFFAREAEIRSVLAVTHAGFIRTALASESSLQYAEFVEVSALDWSRNDAPLSVEGRRA